MEAASEPRQSNCMQSPPLAEDCIKYVRTMSKEILKCGECHTSFGAHVRVPLMLPCFHAFCDQCLRRATKEGTVTCPTCQRVTPRDREFPVDSSRLALRLFRHGVRCGEGVPCDGCSEGARATCYCQNCREFLCADCWLAHRRVKYTKSHTVVCLAEAVQWPAKYVRGSNACDLHPEENMMFYCKCCKKTICNVCVQDTHKDCDGLVALDAVLNGKKREIQTHCEKLDAIMDTFQTKLGVCERYVETVDINLRQALKQIEVVFADLISAAKERHQELAEELRGKAKVHVTKIEEQTASLHSMLSTAQITADFGRRILALNQTAQIMTHHAEIETTVGKLKSRTADVIHSPPVYQTFSGITQPKTQERRLSERDKAIRGSSHALCLTFTNVFTHLVHQRLTADVPTTEAFLKTEELPDNIPGIYP